jgi:hypothetical protein
VSPEAIAFLNSKGVKIEETTTKTVSVSPSIKQIHSFEIKMPTLQESLGRVTPLFAYSFAKDSENEWTVEHPDKKFNEYLSMYTMIPTAKNAVDNLSNFAIQSGYELEGGKVETAKKFLDVVNFDQLGLNVLKQMIIYGNAYVEVGEALKILPAEQMHVTVSRGGDHDGEIVGYKQILGTLDPIRFKPEQIAHFKWNEIGPAFYGISDLKAVEMTLTALYNYQNDLGIIMHRYAQPLLHHKLGRPEAPANKEQIDDYTAMVEDRDTGEDFVTSSDVEIDSIQADMKMVQPDGILTHLENQLIAGLNIPATFLRGGTSSNKATAEVELQAFDRKVKAIRAAFTEVVEDKILNKFNCKIRWREMSIQDESVKATMIRDLGQAQVPPEVSFKLVGWDNYIEDLKKAKPLIPPTPFGVPGQPKPKKPVPKESDYKTQGEWLEAIEDYKKVSA